MHAMLLAALKQYLRLEAFWMKSFEIISVSVIDDWFYLFLLRNLTYMSQAYHLCCPGWKVKTF
jgi:hypothetical protein